jgi:mxaD protein
MKKLLLPALLLVSSTLHAHGPTPQKVQEIVDIAAPADQVWAVVKNFGDLARWNPALTKSEGSGTNGPGGRRTLTFPNGEQLVEDLDTLDDQAHEYSYRLAKDNVKALPASSYSAVLRVTAAGSGSRVEWKSRLYRGDTGNEPPESLNDEAAVKAMQGLFRSGLDQLKKTVEGGS